MEPAIQDPGAGPKVDPQSEPDLMNDPAFDPNTKDKKSSTEEPDTCRICRGEGSDDEPLFYPCKCSGSIKFVHQNCLVEWLSHSQKKHCELCKTPFRFTKLYSPNMPNTVPLLVFLRQAAIHTWRSFVTSSRLLLVIFVWGFWLPWCMQTIWKSLFWIGDGAWANWNERKMLNTSLAYGLSSSLTTEGTTTTAQDPLTPNEATASTFIAQISSRLPRFIPTADKFFSYSSGQPWTLLLLKKVYAQLKAWATPSNSSAPSAAANVTTQSSSMSRSWLSDFNFMKTLTPSSMVNNMLIDTFEGQLITLFVVTIFILIFLIREWVVQQQPIINGGANINAGVPVAQIPPAPQPENRLPGEGHAGDQADGDGHEQGHRRRMVALARPQRPTNPRLQSEQGEAGSASLPPISSGENEGAASSDGLPRPTSQPTKPAGSGVDQDPPRRPALPDRLASTWAAEISRILAELSQSCDEHGSSIEFFKDLWDRSGKDSLEVIRTIEREGRSDELGWIIASMRQLDELQARLNWEANAAEPTEIDGEAANRDRSKVEEHIALLEPPSENLPFGPAVKRSTSKEFPNDSVTPSPVSAQSELRDQENTDHEQSARNSSSSQERQRSQSDVVDQVLKIKGPGTPTPGSLSASPLEHSVEPGVDSDNLAGNNPFHPDYEGELPPTSAYSDDGVSTRGVIDPDDTAHPDASSGQSDAGQTSNSSNAEGRRQDKSIREAVADWLWGGVAPTPATPDQPAGDDEQIVNDIADEAPFVAVDHGQPLPLAANDGAVANQDPDVVAAAIQAGINPNEVDAAEEIEDLEGIMELIGMQGPLAGLVQNGMFCACLVSLTILLGVWIPYISGKLFLILLAHPISLLFRIPLRWAAYTADTIIDVFTFCVGCAFYWTDTIVSALCASLGLLVPVLGRIGQTTIVADVAKTYAQKALERLANTSAATGGFLLETDIPMFSLIAHESLQSIKTRVTWVAKSPWNQIAALVRLANETSSAIDFMNLVAHESIDYTNSIVTFAIQRVSSVLSSSPSLLQLNPLRINVKIPQRQIPLDYDLASWNFQDRVLAVAFGYLFFALLGVAYLHLSSRVKGTDRNGRVAGGLADSLYQAGGVMKVILIISIEMIVFPLYCGLLLDVALLPLFDNVTLTSRINFTLNSPNTSLFVHWFVGTCYMFHFALFVSMCRKILRSGVLYFIRDPDDPTFHPVRDVLERSVSTQLWKISFSALVYGGLVIICLGGVVWSIAYAFNGVFPIHWASDEPVLEFPLDLLFYNFLMPFAIKFFRPSNGLNKIFDWWFRICARALRLTNFLFGEEREDEEGGRKRRKVTHFTVSDNALTGELEIKEGQPKSGPSSSKVTEEYFERNGRYVRAPGSDQVRIPRGAQTFLEVDKDNRRLDGQIDSDDGLHGRKNDMFKKVYIPPFFRLRISAFIFLIWVFAAAAGISMTVLPLVFGRLIFTRLAPRHLHMNDIYAFSIGIYILGGALYGALQYRRIRDYVRSTLTPHATTAASFLRKAGAVSLHALSILYAYTAFGIFLPALFSTLMEFYFIIPIHTYFSTTYASLENIQSERHIVHLIQDWTLGVLYLKMVVRIILFNTPSRPANALRAVVRDGWFNPDVRLATRGFIIPATVAVGMALAAPLMLGWLANATILRSFSANNDVFRVCVYRYSYPGVLGLGFAIMSTWLLAKAFAGWRKKIRDEVYLIGERLHNFGETRRRKGKAKGKGKAVVIGGPA